MIIINCTATTAPSAASCPVHSCTLSVNKSRQKVAGLRSNLFALDMILIWRWGQWIKSQIRWKPFLCMKGDRKILQDHDMSEYTARWVSWGVKLFRKKKSSIDFFFSMRVDRHLPLVGSLLSGCAVGAMLFTDVLSTLKLPNFPSLTTFFKTERAWSSETSSSKVALKSTTTLPWLRIKKEWQKQKLVNKIVCSFLSSENFSGCRCFQQQRFPRTDSPFYYFSPTTNWGFEREYPVVS